MPLNSNQSINFCIIFTWA